MVIWMKGVLLLLNSAQVQAKEALLKGCIHQSETDFVFEMNKCTTLKEAVSEVKRLVATASNKKALTVRAFSPTRPDYFQATRHQLAIFLKFGSTIVSHLIEGVIILLVRSFELLASLGVTLLFPRVWDFSPNRGRRDFSSQSHHDLSPE